MTNNAPYWASLIVGLTICQTLAEKFGEKSAKQKWINDIYVDDKKVGGILCTCTNNSAGKFEL